MEINLLIIPNGGDLKGKEIRFDRLKTLEVLNIKNTFDYLYGYTCTYKYFKTSNFTGYDGEELNLNEILK